MNEDDKTPAVKGYLTANFLGGNMDIYSLIVYARNKLDRSWNWILMAILREGLDGFKKKWGLTDD